MGTTNRSGSLPIVFMLTTTAGRIFWISAPIAGSKSISQISPRLGTGAVAMQVILAEGFEGGQRDVVPVVFLGPGGGGLQDRIALLWRKLPQLGGSPCPTDRRGVLNVHTRVLHNPSLLALQCCRVVGCV